MQSERVAGLLIDLGETLRLSAELVARGRDAFNNDLAVRLAFEALSNRVGDVSKQLVLLDPSLFSEPIWCLAARNRDKIVHHYQLIDPDMLWNTVAGDFPQLHTLSLSKTAG